MMDYAAFRAHVLDFSWRADDGDLQAALDNIITMAGERIDADLATVGRSTTLVFTPVGDYPLPGDYAGVLGLVSSVLGPMRWLPFSETVALRQEPDPVAAYTIASGALMFVNPTLLGSCTFSYFTGVPNYAVDDTSFISTNYLRLYTLACMVDIALYVQDDQRLQQFETLYLAQLDRTLERDAFFKGTPAAAPMPRPAGIIRR